MKSAPKSRARKAAAPEDPPLRFKRTRAEKKLDTRERIQAAALELFADEGFQATTTKEVAKRAGIASGTLFLHASDKEDLLFLVMHDALAKTVDDAFATLPRGAQVTLLAQLLHVFRCVYRMYAEMPDLAKPFVASLPGASGPNAQRVTALTFAFLHRVAQLVLDAQARGEVAKDVDPLVAAQNAFAAYFLALLNWISGFATPDTMVDPVLKNALALQIRGLAPR